jgi:hypothetical protein
MFCSSPRSLLFDMKTDLGPAIRDFTRSEVPASDQLHFQRFDRVSVVSPRVDLIRIEMMRHGQTPRFDPERTAEPP